MNALGMKESETGAPPRAGKSLLLRVTGSAVALGLVLWILPKDELGSALSRLSLSTWASAVGIYLALHLLGVLKWRMLVNGAGAGLRLSDAARFYYTGLFSNTFLPSVVGGDVVRAGLALGRVHSRMGLVFGSVVDRLLDVGSLGLVAAIGVLMIPSAAAPQARQLFLGLAAVGLIGMLVLGLVVASVPARRLPFRMRRRVARIRQAVRALSRRPLVLIGGVMLGMSLQVSLVLLNAWLAVRCGLPIPVHAWMVAWPLAKIAAVTPFTQGGIGVREAALATLLATFGVPAVASVAAGLAFQAIIISGGLVGGFLAFVLPRRRSLAISILPRRAPASGP